MVDTDIQSAKSRNFAIILLSNKNLSHYTFSSVLHSVVFLIKCRSRNVNNRIMVDKKMDTAGSIINLLENDMISLSTINKYDLIPVKDCAKVLKTTLTRQNATQLDSEFISFISFTDAFVVLGKIFIKQAKIERVQKAQKLNNSQASMAHATLARNFQRCNATSPYDTDHRKYLRHT